MLLMSGENSIDLQQNDKKEKKEEKQSVIAEIFDYYELCIFSVCIVIVIFSFFIRLCRVDGQSMEDTLHHGEMLVVSDIFYTPKEGDVIVFHQTGGQNQDIYSFSLNEPIVKRVIATSGEWIDIKLTGDKLTVTVYDKNKENPRVLKEDYAKYSGSPSWNPTGYHEYPLQIPDGYVFVMGDNRWHSTDSRSALVGLVDTRRILGQATFRVAPFSRFGAIN